MIWEFVFIVKCLWLDNDRLAGLIILDLFMPFLLNGKGYYKGINISGQLDETCKLRKWHIVIIK